MEDFDFENYKVEAERETEIRSHLDEIKAKDWLGELLFLLQECGENRVISDANEIPGLGKTLTVKVYEVGLLESQKDIEIELSANELLLKAAQKSLLEISFLPKNHEYVLLYFDRSRAEMMETLREVLAPAIKRAKHLKTERQRAFQERFKNSN